MIWSLVKLIFGVLYMLAALIVNSIKWIFYFGWDKQDFQLFWTDKEKNIQYYYEGNILAWAFQIRRLADSTFNITVVD